MHVDDNCNASITPDDVDNGSWDNVGIVRIPVDVSHFNAGLYTIKVSSEKQTGIQKLVIAR